MLAPPARFGPHAALLFPPLPRTTPPMCPLCPLCTQWNDKDLDALLADSDDEDSAASASSRVTPAKGAVAPAAKDQGPSASSDAADREAARLAEDVAAIKFGGAGAAAKEPGAAGAGAMSAHLRAEMDSLPLSGLYARSRDLLEKIHGGAGVEGCAASPAEREVLIQTALALLARAEDVCDRCALTPTPYTLQPHTLTRRRASQGRDIQRQRGGGGREDVGHQVPAAAGVGGRAGGGGDGHGGATCCARESPGRLPPIYGAVWFCVGLSLTRARARALSLPSSLLLLFSLFSRTHTHTHTHTQVCYTQGGA